MWNSNFEVDVYHDCFEVDFENQVEARETKDFPIKVQLMGIST